MGSVIRLTILLVIATAALAQTATSRMTGTVGDAAGALLPGAMVTAKNEAAGVTYTQMTAEAGLYGFPSLPVGIYTITYIDSGGDSYYHSGQATLRKRFGDGLQAGLAYTLGKSIEDYNSRRPSNALAIVTSSAYSKSPPTGNPNARRVTRIPSGLIKRDKYRAVVSPSTLGFVATITSSTLPECNR